MVRISDPVELRHPKPRESAVIAAWIATAAEAATELEDFLVDVPPQERVLPDFSTPWPWDFAPLVMALSVVQGSREEAEQSLEQLLGTWLRQDPENWSVVRLILIDPWQESPGVWHEDTPESVRSLGTIATTAHAKYDPFGRRPRS